MFDRIILTVPHPRIETFRAVVQRAADAGVTHISISAPPEKSRWEIDDPSDPYLQWSILHASLFKTVVPEILRNWVPADYAQRVLAVYRQRAEVVQAAGLSCAFLAYEPLWWPEAIFREHPHLRGPRVDHPRRSRHARFSPDIGHEQVQAMYQWAVAELARAVPGLSLCIFSTNDSGVGLPWVERLYNHPNGPTERRGASVGELVRDWFAACRAGAEAAGVQGLDFYIRGAFVEHEFADLGRALLGEDGAARVASFGPNPLKSADAIQGLAAQYFYPVRELGQPLELVRGLRAAAGAGRHGVIVNPMAEAYVTEWDGSGPELAALRRYLAQKPDSVLDEQQTVHAALVDHFGEAHAHAFFEMYWHLDRAAEALSALWAGGSMLLNSVVAQRWITRPLVPFPERLTAEEKAHFRPHQFQALDEAAADNPLEFQGTQLLHSRAEAERIIMPLLKRAQRHVRQAAQALTAAEDQPETAALVRRMQALERLIRTADHFGRFYTRLAEVKQQRRDPQTGAFTPPPESSQYHHGERESRTALYTLMRAEIDNTQGLIDLLEADAEPPLVLAAEHEDTFTLSPDLAAQLRRKIEITWDHWLDLDQLLARPNL